MTLRRVLTQRLPAYPEEAPTWQTLLTEVVAMPLIAPIHLFWTNLKDARPWWPVLLPLMALTAWRTYRRERRKFIAYKREQAALRAQAAATTSS